MSQRLTLIFDVLLVSLLGSRPDAQTMPFSFEVNDTISAPNPGFAGLVPDHAGKITVALDDEG